MLDHPLVSVVMPAFNPGPHLREALGSVLSQTYESWDCVVVDDGSTEDLSWVLGLDARIRLIRQDNRGLPSARNTGALATSGQLVAFLDADDLWLPDKLGVQVKAMRDGAVLSATAFYRFDEERRFSGWHPRANSLDELLRGNSICASSTMVDRLAFERLGMFDERLRSAEDWDMWLRLVRYGGPVAAVSEPLVGYRVHSGQMSNKTRKMWMWSLRVLAKQRGPLLPTLQGVRRVGVVYGAQMFDAFRAGRQLSQLAWSFVMWPDYVLQQLWLQLLSRIAPSDRRSPTSLP